MRKSKILAKVSGLLVLLASFFILGTSAVPVFAQTICSDRGCTTTDTTTPTATTTTTSGACDKFTSAANRSACEACNKDSACVACHPEYNYGRALTPNQLSSCIACQNNKTPSDSANCLQNNVIIRDLNDIVNILSGIVGVIVVGVIIAGGIQYSMAGKPEAAAAARKRIINGLIALFAFIFIWAFLQWIIPGGI